MVHCHGGGFVSQSSKSHEVYLRNWAVSLDVPILSIDYSLAPEAPFPRALEEILYTYAWVLNHSSTLLGSTAQKIIFIGNFFLSMSIVTLIFYYYLDRWSQKKLLIIQIQGSEKLHFSIINLI